MAFQTDRNIRRVEKIVETLQHIARSAASNRTSSEAVSELLNPVFDTLHEMNVLQQPADAVADQDAERSPLPEAARDYMVALSHARRALKHIREATVSLKTIPALQTEDKP